MFKFVVLSCLVSVAFGGVLHHTPLTVAQVKTVVEPHYSVVETPTVQHVGSQVLNVPSGVSHHSSSVVHSATNIVEPIYAHGVQKSVVNTPVAKQYIEQVPAVIPVQKTIYTQAAPLQYAASPVHYAAPLQYAASPVHYEASPVHYEASPVHYAASPIQYAASPVHYAASPIKTLSYSALPAAYSVPSAYAHQSVHPSAYAYHH